MDMALCLGSSGCNFRELHELMHSGIQEEDTQIIKQFNVQRVTNGHVKWHRRRRQVLSLLEIGVLGVATLNPYTSLR